MRKSYKFKKREQPQAKKYNCNHNIRATELVVIDENNSNLGVMPKFKAIELSMQRGYDLVEVVPTANPPIAKLLNYGSFMYQKEKQFKKQKSQNKSLEVKSIRLSSKIGEHDMDTKANQANKFLEKGNKIKVEIILKGRENQHADLARATMDEFKTKLTVATEVEQDFSRQGTKVFIILMPKSTN